MATMVVQEAAAVGMDQALLLLVVLEPLAKEMLVVVQTILPHM